MSTTQQWIYEPSADGSARFVLGTVGENPLVCFGINPSTAVPGKLDPTVTRVEGFATDNGYDSWIMLNVYPQISTDPKGIGLVPQAALKVANEHHIAELLEGRQPPLLAAWGGLITSRKYLPGLLEDIVSLTDAAGCSWVSLGDSIGGGHLRHPSRARKDSLVQPFDMSNYLDNLA